MRGSLQVPKSSGQTKGLIPLPGSRDGSEKSLLNLVVGLILNLVMGLLDYASRPALITDWADPNEDLPNNTPRAQASFRKQEWG